MDVIQTQENSGKAIQQEESYVKLQVARQNKRQRFRFRADREVYMKRIELNQE
jgi:hypothetical protein